MRVILKFELGQSHLRGFYCWIKTNVAFTDVSTKKKFKKVLRNYLELRGNTVLFEPSCTKQATREHAKELIAEWFPEPKTVSSGGSAAPQENADGSNRREEGKAS